MISVCFSICCLIFIFILSIAYFTKQKINNFDNRVYTTVMLLNLIGIIIDVGGFISFRNLGANNILNHFISKIYLLYYISYIFCLMIYIYNLSFNNLSKIIKKVIMAFLFVCLLIFSLPINIHFDNSTAYTYGLSVNVSYFFAFSFIIFMIFCLFKNIKKLRNKEYYPLIAFVILTFLCLFIQKLYPSITLLLTSNSIVTFLMYFTIENPDVKQMKELERNNEITEQSYIDKSNFIFEMTQEVREPLNYIKNTSKVLIDNNPTKDEYKEGLGYIYNASRQLDFVVNDVLNVSTLDVQKVKVLNNRYNLDRLYEDLIKRVEPSINNNVKFRYSIPNNIPYLYGDNIKLKQVLYSLLMNAVKKTENGFIEFNVNTIEKYDVCRVIFRITDSGCGIGLEKINEILSVTGELNKEDIENLEKSEFNIELCQKIIKSLGGNLLIKSKLGKGTEVILTIDQKIYREEEKIVNNNNYGTKKVLVVCQDKKIREIIKKVLNENEINGSYILYGLDAVDRIKSGKKYDYIIIEDEMKEINGYETIKKLKNLKEFKIPCIVLLNENKEKIKKYYIKDGYSDYILTRELRNELKRIIDKY